MCSCGALTSQAKLETLSFRKHCEQCDRQRSCPRFAIVFVVTGLAGPALLQAGLMMVVRSNFTDRLKRALTLFR